MFKDVKNPKISKKFENKKNLKIKKNKKIQKKMLFSQFCQFKRLVFDQSSPVQRWYIEPDGVRTNKGNPRV